MENLKIALVSDWYYPKIGGVAVHIHDLAIHLSRRGHEVDIITNSQKTGKEDELKREGIGLIKVPGHIMRSVGINTTVLARRARSLQPILEKYDIVHGQHAFTPLALKAVSSARKAGKGTLLTTHSVNFEHSRTLKELVKLVSPYFKHYLKKPHRVIAVSKASKEFIREFTDVPVEVIYNGISLERFRDDWDKESLKSELGVEGPMILYVGRIEPRKGVGTLISAMKNIKGRLVVVGNGSNLPLLRKKAKHLGILDRIDFMGHVEYSEIPKLYGASDVFVLPSLSEAFGIVLLEAMASGVPVVGTSAGGIPEILDGCGMVVQPGNADELADAINLLLDNQNLAGKLGRLGRRRVERVYDWRIIAKKVESTYMKVLDEVSGDDKTGGPNV
ncbi:glycosyltransferase family 4 protein [Thermococcus sp.]|uniref:glycosyltransferase family 4 protein n=1 Tax=Thermococcus sp. TaxID=35749 RepID=UPI0025F2E69D|nr:glycosyltransferase family 4 protein [Thermococcus sp.]